MTPAEIQAAAFMYGVVPESPSYTTTAPVSNTTVVTTPVQQTVPIQPISTPSYSTTAQQSSSVINPYDLALGGLPVAGITPGINDTPVQTPVQSSIITETSGTVITSTGITGSSTLHDRAVELQQKIEASPVSSVPSSSSSTSSTSNDFFSDLTDDQKSSYYAAFTGTLQAPSTSLSTEASNLSYSDKQDLYNKINTYSDNLAQAVRDGNLSIKDVDLAVVAGILPDANTSIDVRSQIGDIGLRESVRKELETLPIYTEDGKIKLIDAAASGVSISQLRNAGYDVTTEQFEIYSIYAKLQPYMDDGKITPYQLSLAMEREGLTEDDLKKVFPDVPKTGSPITSEAVTKQMFMGLPSQMETNPIIKAAEEMKDVRPPFDDFLKQYAKDNPLTEADISGNSKYKENVLESFEKGDYNTSTAPDYYEKARAEYDAKYGSGSFWKDKGIEVLSEGVAPDFEALQPSVDYTDLPAMSHVITAGNLLILADMGAGLGASAFGKNIQTPSSYLIDKGFTKTADVLEKFSGGKLSEEAYANLYGNAFIPGTKIRTTGEFKVASETDLGSIAEPSYYDYEALGTTSEYNPSYYSSMAEKPEGIINVNEEGYLSYEPHDYSTISTQDYLKSGLTSEYNPSYYTNASELPWKEQIGTIKIQEPGEKFYWPEIKESPSSPKDIGGSGGAKTKTTTATVEATETSLPPKTKEIPVIEEKYPSVKAAPETEAEKSWRYGEQTESSTSTMSSEEMMDRGRMTQEQFAKKYGEQSLDYGDPNYYTTRIGESNPALKQGGDITFPVIETGFPTLTDNPMIISPYIKTGEENLSNTIFIPDMNYYSSKSYGISPLYMASGKVNEENIPLNLTLVKESTLSDTSIIDSSPYISPAVDEPITEFPDPAPTPPVNENPVPPYEEEPVPPVQPTPPRGEEPVPPYNPKPVVPIESSGTKFPAAGLPVGGGSGSSSPKSSWATAKMYAQKQSRIPRTVVYMPNPVDPNKLLMPILRKKKKGTMETGEFSSTIAGKRKVHTVVAEEKFKAGARESSYTSSYRGRPTLQHDIGIKAQ